MAKEYKDLHALLQQDREACRFYDSLPDYVQDSIRQRAESVRSVESLRDYAENLTREDE